MSKDKDPHTGPEKHTRHGKAKRLTAPPPVPETRVPTPAGEPVLRDILRAVRTAEHAVGSLWDALVIAVRQLPEADRRHVEQLAEDAGSMRDYLARHREKLVRLVPPVRTGRAGGSYVSRYLSEANPDVITNGTTDTTTTEGEE